VPCTGLHVVSPKNLKLFTLRVTKSYVSKVQTQYPEPEKRNRKLKDLQRQMAHSHSMVAGGLEETS